MVNAPLCIVYLAEKMLFLIIVYFGNGLIVYAKHITAMETFFYQHTRFINALIFISIKHI